MITENQLTNIEYFHADSVVYGGRTFNLVAEYNGHKFFMRENIPMSDLARMDINTVETHMRPRLMEKLLAQIHQEFPNG